MREVEIASPDAAPDFDGHELVVWAIDRVSGLRSVIAVHSTALGPATGGTRFRKYDCDADMLRDALRLSRAMTYKCALAGVPFGGGKGVISSGPVGGARRTELLREYARRINLLKGTFTTGEDAGIDNDDVRVMAEESHYINIGAGAGGDLSKWASEGVVHAMRAAAREVFGTPSLHGRVCAVKGVGKMGSGICEILLRHGAIVHAADIDSRPVDRLRKRWPALIKADPRSIHRMKADIFVPCALGGDLSRTTIPSMRCAIVCGAANNQLLTEEDGVRLHRAGILYVPDYLANAGGLIGAVAHMVVRAGRGAWVERKVRSIGDTVADIIRRSAARRAPVSEVADASARRILEAARRRKNRAK